MAHPFICPNCGHYLEQLGKVIATRDGELVEIGKHDGIGVKEREQFHSELRHHAHSKGFRPGWAAHKYKEKFGVFPPWDWNQKPAAPPSVTTQRWLQSRNIAWRRARDRA